MWGVGRELALGWRGGAGRLGFRAEADEEFEEFEEGVEVTGAARIDVFEAAAEDVAAVAGFGAELENKVIVHAGRP
jgi:hypothetical protein